jgi:hypothetical protein
MQKIIIIISFLCLATACNSKSTKNSLLQPTVTKVSSPYLVSVINRGGLCSYGLCEAEYTILHTGELKKTLFEFNKAKKTYEKITQTEVLNPTDFIQLKSLIQTTDFSGILKSQFTEICPSAYDGEQNLFSFYPNNQEIKLDSCQQIINPANEPFKLIYQLIFK